MPMARRPITRPLTSPSKTTCLVTQADASSTSAPLLAQEDGSGQVVAFHQISDRPVEQHPALLHEDGPLGDRGSHIQRLLDHDDSHALGLQPSDYANQLLDHYRRQPKRQL